MGVTTSHHISNYYDFFRDKEIVFTKANVKALHIDPRQVYLKCNGGQWPCIINSSSLQQAKVFVGATSGVFALIRKQKDLPVSIRYCFIDNNQQPVMFFVNCTVTEVKQYEASKELVILTLNFTQRPPDDLILRLGEFLEVNENFKTRKEERISLNENSLRQLSIPKEESYVFISGVPRKCIMKDLSFGGARVMLVGIPKFLLEKKVELKIFFTDTNEKVSVAGVVKGANFLEGRKDICVINIEYDLDDIPMSYKFHVNSYITSYQKQIIEKQLLNEQKRKQQERREELAQQARKQAKEEQASKDTPKPDESAVKAPESPQSEKETEVKAEQAENK